MKLSVSPVSPLSLFPPIFLFLFYVKPNSRQPELFPLAVYQIYFSSFNFLLVYQ
jgi:hypothetical protein